MSQNRYYYYDHETCSFVEIKARRSRKPLRTGIVFIGALIIGLAVWLLQHRVGTPYELALEAENHALQQQLTEAEQRMEQYSAQLTQLAQVDQSLYRTLLQAEPISEDVRQAGTGGTDVYQDFDRFSPSVSRLLRQSSEQLDQLEQQIQLQNASYRELTTRATERNAWLAEMPAILPAGGPIVSGYGMRRHPILRVNRMHTGIDIVVRTGTPVVATGDGVVVETGSGGAYGRFVRIKHEAPGYFTLYAHLSEIPAHIKPGRQVKRSEQIGLSGNSGRSTSPHLHYEVRDADNRPLNPTPFFAPGMTPQQYRSLLEAAENSQISLD
jgi:murein DD-endopeptidase MepM/ murein hydrolase activator NlpD